MELSVAQMAETALLLFRSVISRLLELKSTMEFVILAIAVGEDNDPPTDVERKSPPFTVHELFDMTIRLLLDCVSKFIQDPSAFMRKF